MGILNGDDYELINIESNKMAIAALIVVLPLFLAGCTSLPIIERNHDSGVLQEEFTETAKPLTNELNDYEEIEAVYLEDDEIGYLEALIRQSLKDDPGITENHLDVNKMDLQLYQNGDSPIYFIGLLQDQRQNPYTVFAQMQRQEGKDYKIVNQHIAAYPVNLPKAYLLEKGEDWVIVSQSPFSTFEECYFFKMKGKHFDLYKRGWQDRSLLYYEQVSSLLKDGKIDEAMALPDESMYPMAYEEPLFEVANLWVKEGLKNAHIKEEKNDVETAVNYLDWSLNYYFQNHYGKDLVQMTSESFADISIQDQSQFGSRYLMSNAEMKEALIYYGNLLGALGDEKQAKAIKDAISKISD